MRPRHLAAVLLAAAVPAASLATAAPAKPKPKSERGKGNASFTYALPGERTFPEGIAVSDDGRRFFVSSTTDGTIFAGRVDGRSATTFLPGGEDGRTTAIGLEVDRGRLFVAGGATGSVFVYDLATRELVRRFDSGEGGFINDIAITRDGDAYVTDSRRTNLYVIPRAAVEAGRGDTAPLERLGAYPDAGDGFKANGIVAVDDDTLIYVNSSSGELVRVELGGREPAFRTVDLGGATVENGDGLVLRKRTLYVVRNAAGVIAEIRLDKAATAGRLRGETSDPTFGFPTTAAAVRNRLLVVNSQFDKRSSSPELPFTVSSIKRP